MVDIRLRPPEIEDNPLWTVNDLAGGLNEGFASGILDNQARELQNMLPYEIGSIETRRGCTKLNATSIGLNPIWALYSFDRPGSYEILAASGTDIYKWDGTNFVSIKSGLTANQRVRFDTWRGATDLCLMVNGAQAPLKYDGTTVANLGGSPPIASLVKVHRDRVFLNNMTYRSRFHWSDALAPETWGANSWMDVPGDDKITGFAVWLDSLIIFKEKTIWFLYGTGPTNWELKRGSPIVGATSQEAIVPLSSDLLFLTRKGVHRLSGVTTELTYAFDALKAVELTDHIRTTRDGLNQSLLDKAAAIGFNDWYWLSVAEGSSTYHNLVLAIDPFYDPPRIFPIRGWNLASLCVSRQAGEDRLFGGSSQSGQVWRLDWGTNDDGVAINAYLKTKYFGSSQVYQRLKKLHLVTENVGNWEVNVEMMGDFGQKNQVLTPITLTDGTSLFGTAVFGTDVFGGAEDVIAKRYLRDAFRFVSFHFYGSGLNEPFSLKNLSVWADIEQR